MHATTIRHTIAYLLFSFIFLPVQLYSKSMQQTYKKNISIPIEVHEKKFIDKDLLSLSVDHPQIHIDSWHTTIEPTTKYDSTIKENKKMFDRSFAIEAKISSDQKYDDAAIHVSYFQYSTRTMHEKIIPLEWQSDHNAGHVTTQQAIDTDAEVVELSVDTLSHHTSPSNSKQSNASFSCYVQNLVQHSENIWLRLLLVLLLGLLMSLTPCIYPMIPITVGILQSQGSSSMLRSFLLSLSYTTGIATMFALLGLLAASTGQMFGTIMSNPIVILCIVALLLYLAGSMLGLYEMYTPRFLSSTNSTQVKKGSFFSVFLFGFISGSIASPCLSPGLILLLTIVAALKSKLLGFALLFCFGIGLSIPLLIVGTFSSALTTLPRAGMWMVEVKKFFGFLLIGMCFYFLNMILPWYIIMALITVTTLIIGVWHLVQPAHSSTIMKRISNIIAIISITCSLLLALESYKAYVSRNECSVSNDIWITDYACAQEKAMDTYKPLLIKVGGPCCSLCTAIDNKQFADKQVLNTLEKEFICAKIDGSQATNAMTELKNRYQIFGMPTIIIINPQTTEMIKKWQGELYHIDPTAFDMLLHDIAQTYHTK